MTTRVLGISASPIVNGNTEAFLREALAAAAAMEDVSIEAVSLAKMDIKDCIHCNFCLRKQSEGRFCSQQDDMSALYPRVLAADVLMLASPAYMGRQSGRLACFLDRLRVFTFGNVYRGKLKDKVGAAFVVSWLRNYGGETTAQSIVQFFLAMTMLPVGPPHGFGSMYGAVGLSSEHGEGAFDRDDRHGVLKDSYGLEGARRLAVRAVETGKRLGK
ncbi:MAG: flavodoxin family protein [Chloroflexi bacterium]|nr:flavodoxin family protein [Chloroflexota bacterium]